MIKQYNAWIARALIMVLFVLVAGCLSVREARLGDQFAQDRNWEGAVVAYQAAVDNRPTDLKLRDKLRKASANAAAFYFARGKVLLRDQKINLAVQDFKKALSLDPSKQDHHEALGRALQSREALSHFKTGRRFAHVGRLRDAIEEFEKTLELNPESLEAQEALKRVSEELEEQEDEGELALKSTQPITLKFQKARIKEVFELLSKTSGINILFDKDVRDDQITIFVRDVSFLEALSLILTTNNLFMKKINDETIIIIPKIKKKVDQYQDLLIRTFYLSNVKAKDMVNLLRTMLETRRVFVNNEINAIVLRDTPEKIKLAERIIEANDRKLAEVVFDVEILEVDRKKAAKYGWEFSPNQSTFSMQAPGGSSTFTLQQFNNIGEASYLFSIPSIVVDFLKTQSFTKTLANPKIRILNNESAKIAIGDKIPVLLSSTQFSSGITGTTPGTNVTTNIEFKDVGLSLTVDKINIHLNNDVTVKVSLDITTLGPLIDVGGGANDDRRSFGNRSIETVLNIQDGETVVIGGLIREDERESISKFPGLGDIPILGYLFSGFDTGTDNTDILLTITPHIVRGLDPPDEAIQEFWSGTGEAYSTKPLFSDFAPFGGLREGGVHLPLPEDQGGPPRKGSKPNSRKPQRTPGGLISPIPPIPFPVPSGSKPSPTGFLPLSQLKSLSPFEEREPSWVLFDPPKGDISMPGQIPVSNDF